MCAQLPSVDSDEHASYCKQVSKGTWPTSCTNWYAPVALPPWHEPATSVPQFRMNWIARFTSGPRASGPFAILMRSARADIAPCAQHEPQYCGTCWLSILVK